MAQNTVVTALITDPSGNPYKNCSFDVSLVNLTGSGTLVNISGSTFQTQYNGGSCDSTGTLVQPLFDSTVISPAGTQWKFNICDITGKTCFNYTTPACPTAGCITGASINISAAISAVAPSLSIAGNAGTGLNNIFTGVNTFTGSIVNGSSVILNSGSTGIDWCAKVQAGHDAFPATGGIISAIGLNGAQACATRVNVTKPVTIYVSPDLDLTCNDTVNQRCITGSVPYSIIGGASSWSVSALTKQGSRIKAGAGFTGYILESVTTVHFDLTMNTKFEGLLLDGNLRTASCIHFSGGFALHAKDSYLNACFTGVALENISGVANFTEGSYLDNIYIENPTFGIDMFCTGGGISFENSNWNRIYIDLLQSNSVGVRLQPHQDGTCIVDTGNAVWNGLKIWFAGAGTNRTGVFWRGPANGHLINELMCEGQSSGSNDVCFDGTVAVTTCTRASNVVTCTTGANHFFPTSGTAVAVRGTTAVTNTFNGQFAIASASNTTFTYAQTGANESTTGGGTAGLILPMFANLRAAGTGLASPTFKLSGADVGPVDNYYGLHNVYRIIGAGGIDPARPTYSFLGSEQTGLYSLDGSLTSNTGFGASVNGTSIALFRSGGTALQIQGGGNLSIIGGGSMVTAFINLGGSQTLSSVAGTGTALVSNTSPTITGTTQVGQVLSSQGTVCTNGELALSAGWGTTATVTAVAGTGQTCHWTITSSGTGQAANPTITDTLTNALPTATTVCDMRMEGGTGTNTLIQQTTLSATAPVFTFNGTPVAASTYIVVRRCGP